MKRKLKKGVKIFIFFIIILITVPIFSYRFYVSMLGCVDPNSTENIRIDIPMGTSLRKTASVLKENRLIKNEQIFLLYAKVNDRENIKSGNYDFSQNENVESILLKLNEGSRPIGEKVTIPEGFERINIAEKLSSMGLVDQERFMELTEHKEEFIPEFSFLEEENIHSLEGYLYPDTYYIEKGMDEKKIIELFLRRFDEIYEENHLREELVKRNSTLNDLITMASIVEREAVLDEERSLIAGVFYNRLNIGMPLQSCATVQYILKERKPILSTEDTKIDSPYNTYLNKGIPPTPIASPGIQSIRAALNPEKSEYLYFVARGDGGHEFSKTYDEHLKAKKTHLGN